MDEAFHSGEDLGERAEGGDADDLDVDLGADGIVSLEHFPRAVFDLLVAQGDLLVLSVKGFDVHVHGIAHVDDLGRMLDALPGKLGAMDHAVHASQIDERAVIGKGLDDAGILHTFFDRAPEFLLDLLAHSLVGLTDGADCSAAALVDIDHDEVDRLVEHILQAAASGHGGKRSGDEDADAVGNNNQSFADHFNNVAFENCPLLFRFNDSIPILDGVVTLLREHDGAFHIIRLHDDQVQLVADLQLLHGIRLGVVAVLVDRDVARLLSSDIHLDLIRGDVHNGAYDTLVVVHAAEGFLKSLLKGHFLCGFSRNSLSRVGFSRVDVDIDLGHGFYYLLNFTFGSGRSRGNSDRCDACKIDFF